MLGMMGLVRKTRKHRCQPSRFRRDSPKFDCYVPLSHFANLLSRFWSFAPHGKYCTTIRITISLLLFARNANN